MLPLYPELISLIELVEQNNKTVRYLRLVRDLFQSNEEKRQFATSVLRSSMCESEEDLPDLLDGTFNLRQPSAKIAMNLDLINNTSYNYASFAIADIDTARAET